MKLFNFPLVVLDNILKQIPYGNLFLISLCSKKSISMIQMVGWKHIKEILYIIGIHEESEKGVVFIYIVDKLKNRSEVFSMQAFSFTMRGSSEITIFDKKTRWWHPYETHPFEIFLLGDDIFLQKIYTQFDNLFGKHAETTVEQLYTICPKKFLPIHLNIVRSHYRGVGLNPNYTYDLKDLEDYFESIPEQEYVELNMAKMNTPLNPDSKFFNASRLVMFYSENNTEHILENFKGENICLLNANFQCEWIIVQLKRWKSKEGYLGLKKLYIKCSLSFDFNSMDSEEFEKELNMKTLPPSILPPVVELTQMHGLFPAEVTIPTYITRNDGIVALLSVTLGMIVLSVRNFTEEEMLEGNCIE
ncbi:hypothetical protein CAEBREN_04739 [Caenorhabditis brenneri]|uniref:F-box domain-containing protein n=1 Tax=Caenorhabditis brenneri TaxID=135651 RepID=G0NML1_CAEBE|nr:hypothetical protein CAEBREN_04739 [Caenorhabditis brenneri]